MSDDYEADPYGTAVRNIVEALENALDDGVSGAMNDHEYQTLEDLGRCLITRDPHVEINPRPA